MSASLCAQTTTVSGDLVSVGGAAVSSRAFVRFEIVNCGGNMPRVLGTGVIAQTRYDFAVNSSGHFSGTVYSNSAIDCGGSTPSVYQITAYQNNLQVQPAQTFLINGPAWNLNNATPNTVMPVVNPPTGDTVYLRLDGGNINLAQASGIFNGLSPVTTLGDLIYGTGAFANGRLAGNTTATKKFLSETGTGTVSAPPVWAQVGFSDLNGSAACGQLPALTGDTTSSGCATTVSATHLSSPLPTNQGGTGQNSAATFPASGVVVTEAGLETETNKALTSPTIARMTVNTGVSQGSGFKHQRFGATCTTSGTAFATCTTTYSWTAAFADSNYTVACSGVGAVNNVAALNINTWTASGVTVQVESLNSAGAAVSFGGVDCIAVHD